MATRSRSKPSRLPVEDVAGGDYIKRLRDAGPREGETALSFEIRLAGIEAGRTLVIEEVRRTGDTITAYRRLGVESKNIAAWNRRLGFLLEELYSIPADKLCTGIPRR